MKPMPIARNIFLDDPKPSHRSETWRGSVGSGLANWHNVFRNAKSIRLRLGSGAAVDSAILQRLYLTIDIHSYAPLNIRCARGMLVRGVGMG